MVQFCLNLLYWCTKTVDRCRWVWMVRMETDSNLKKIGPLFFKFALMSSKNDYKLCFVLLSRIHFIRFPLEF